MQQPTVPRKRQIQERIDRAVSSVEALRRVPIVTILDLEAARAEVDTIRDDLARL